MRRWTTAAAILVVALATSGCITVVRSSVSSTGAQGNGPSFPYRGPMISDSGRFVAFESPASNLVPNDTNNEYDVFRRDNQNGQTIRISVANDGSQLAGRSSGAAISGDGNHVAFMTTVPLDPGDTNGLLDVYVRTVSTGTTEWVSRRPDGTPIVTNEQIGGLDDVTMSADGAIVLMRLGNITSAIFRRDRTTDTTFQDPGDPALLRLSNDGRHYVLNQQCGSLGPCLSIANLRTVHDDGSVTGEPVDPSGCGFRPFDISADGSYVVGERFANMPQFQCAGPFGLVRWNRATKRFAPVPVGSSSEDWVKISDSGRIIAVIDGTTLRVVDMATGEVQVADTDAFGNRGPEGVTGATLSGSGRYVTFATTSPLASDDTNNMLDVYTRYSLRPSAREVAPPWLIRSTVGVNRVSVTVIGSGFLPGATASVSGEGVTVESVSVDSAQSLTVNALVAPDAPVGTRTLTVSNTGGFGHADGQCVDCVTVRPPF